VFELGESLAAARRRQGLELPAVEAVTRIRAKHLGSLEAERFEALPGRAYARAFLKSYCDYLGLETALFLEEFDLRWPDEEIEVTPVRLPRRRRFPVRLVLTGAATAGVLGFVAFGGGGGAKPGELPSLAPPQAAHAAAPRVPHARPAAHRRARPVDRRLVIRATRGDCWVLARRGGAAGAVLYEGTLTRGSVVRFLAPRVWIRLGAPGNVDLHRARRVVRGLAHAKPTTVVL
jgi:hypothetical protein